MNEQINFLCHRIAQGLFRPVCWMLFHGFFRVHVFGQENIPGKGGCLIASNHVSGLDPLLAGWLAHRPTGFLARTTLLTGFSGYFLRLLGAHPIERASADRKAIRAGISFIEKGWPLVLFPEGTRSLDGRLQPLLGGVGMIAAIAGAPVVPMYVSGAHRLLPKGKKLPRPGKIFVCFGEPIHPESLRCSESNREWYDDLTSAIRERLLDLQAKSDRMWGKS